MPCWNRVKKKAERDGEKKRKQADEKKMETVFCLVVNLVKSLGLPRNLMMMEYYWTSHA